MLGAAPLPESAGGNALAVPRRRTPRRDGRGGGRRGEGGRLRRCRHGGVHRGAGRRVLLHGDEHAPAGGASGHRTDPRAGPGRMAAARRRRRAAAAGARSRCRRTATRSRCACTPRIPDQNFLPGSGKLQTLRLPAPSAARAHRRRRDRGRHGHHLLRPDDRQADRVRRRSHRRHCSACARRWPQCEIVGPKSNIGFLERLARHPAVVEGRIDTGYLDRHLDEFLIGDVGARPTRVLFAAATAALLHDECAASSGAARQRSALALGARRCLAHRPRRQAHRGAVPARTALRESKRTATTATTSCVMASTDCEVRGARLRRRQRSARASTASRCACRCAPMPRRVLLHDADGQRYSFARAAAFAWAIEDAAGGNQLIAPMPGRIVLVKAKAGDTVEQGQELLVMEAMKMELALKAPRAGTIESISADRRANSSKPTPCWCASPTPDLHRASRAGCTERVWHDHLHGVMHERLQPRPHRRSRRPRRPAERKDPAAGRREDRADRPAVLHRPDHHRGDQLRQPEMGTAAGRRGRGIPRHPQGAGRELSGAGAQPAGLCSGRARSAPPRSRCSPPRPRRSTARTSTPRSTNRSSASCR